MSLKLWLIRHGQTSINAGEWSSKPAEAMLTSLGKEQARVAAMAVDQEPSLIICSPLQRAKDTAEFVSKSWPESSVSILPIQEIIYLSPSKMHALDKEQRKERIELYWQKADPSYRDGDDSESFASFLMRVENFYNEVLKLDGFVVAVGHGQFFKAFQLGLENGFTPSASWMKRFRDQELSSAITNGEILNIYL